MLSSVFDVFITKKVRNFMSHNKNQLLSTFTKVLFCFETCLLISFLLLANNLELVSFTTLFLSSASLDWSLMIIFTAVVQSSFISLGLYNTRFREKSKGVVTRVITSVAFGVIALLLLSPFFNSNPLTLEYISVISIMCIVVFSWLRVLILQIDLFGFNKKTILVLGAGAKASYIENRMRRDADRKNFIVHGFVPTKDDDRVNGIQFEPI